MQACREKIALADLYSGEVHVQKLHVVVRHSLHVLFLFWLKNLWTLRNKKPQGSTLAVMSCQRGFD